MPGLSFVLVTASLAFRQWLLRVRAFDPDEMQHLHSAWSIAQGQLPYRDYFDHHTPWLHYALAPLFLVFRAEQDFDEAVRALMLARGCMWALTVCLLLATYALGRRFFGARAACYGTLFLSNTVMFLAKTLEVRPDVPAALLLVAALLVLHEGLGLDVQERERSRLYCFAGLLLGAALMFTPKVAFALPGACLAVALRRAGGSPRLALGRVGLLGVGVALPPLATAAYWAARGAFSAFWHCTVYVPLHWQRGSGPQELISELLRQDPVHALGLLGVAASAVALVGGHFQGTLLCLPLLGLVVGVFWIPEIARQYLVLLLPLLALFSGRVFAALTEHVLVRLTTRAREATIALVLVALSAPSLSQQLASAEPSNEAFLSRLEFVLANSAPTETVLDGFSGLGVFRPHAYYYYYLLGKIRATWPSDDRRRLLRSLQVGMVAPRLVIWDEYVRTISQPISEFLQRHYVSVGFDPVRVRLFDNGLGRWVDSGARLLGAPAPLGRAHVVLSQGWETPRASSVAKQGGVRARAPLSELLVPVADPRGYVAVVRARIDRTPARMTMIVNGRPVGYATLATAWSEQPFNIPDGVLKRGMNVFHLSWEVSPEGGNGPLVASLELRLPSRDSDSTRHESRTERPNLAGKPLADPHSGQCVAALAEVDVAWQVDVLPRRDRMLAEPAPEVEVGHVALACPDVDPVLRQAHIVAAARLLLGVDLLAGGHRNDRQAGAALVGPSLHTRESRQRRVPRLKRDVGRRHLRPEAE